MIGFTGVNPARIKMMDFDAGDRNNQVKAGTGHIFVDDICLAKP
ncbi:MAG: hypothetical protein NTZ17_10635 [Phycisphaerae bacterium]|nr:hypothetical protein [Phycisphaerae bacterium]